MRNNEHKREYKRLKKALWAGASSSVVTGLIVLGVASPALAETIDSSVPAYTQTSRVSPMHMMRRWNSASKAGSLAESLGLDKEKVLGELKSGKNMKQILQENGIDTTNIGKGMVGRKSFNKRMLKHGLNNLNNTL